MEPDLIAEPRPTAVTAQASLWYVLGDLVYPSRGWIPTSVFLAALADAGHETHAARQALARSAKAGWITPERQGRETWWALSERGHRLIADGQRRISDLGREEPRWDGRWVIVLISIPHARRAIRDRVYRYLTWSGFGTPMPGVWVSPHGRNEQGARFAIRNFELDDTCLSFIGPSGAMGLSEEQMVHRAWNLDDLDAHYAVLLRRHAAHDTTSGPKALRAVVHIDSDLQRLRLSDPQLPEQLAPGHSSRAAARRLLAWRADWLVTAQRYWRELVPRRS